jgi:hypothetical protein
MLSQSHSLLIQDLIKLLFTLEGDIMQLKRGHSLIEGIAVLVLLAIIIELMSNL